MRKTVIEIHVGRTLLLRTDAPSSPEYFLVGAGQPWSFPALKMIKEFITQWWQLF